MAIATVQSVPTLHLSIPSRTPSSPKANSAPPALHPPSLFPGASHSPASIAQPLPRGLAIFTQDLDPESYRADFLHRIQTEVVDARSFDKLYSRATVDRHNNPENWKARIEVEELEAFDRRKQTEDPTFFDIPENPDYSIY